ncbi:MAG: hypothetical protein LBI90_00760 [Treponema sp.]|jgi:hypothetical protein|nr:hypothetical protein [Treponema sp.]
MNTIPTTFDDDISGAYTAVGGMESVSSTGLSAVLLNRSMGQPRKNLFQELEKAGFDYVLSMEVNTGRYDVEDLSTRFPFVRFIIFKEEVNLGKQINLAALELKGSHFFVFWNDQRLLSGGGAGGITDKLSEREDICTVPVLLNSAFETLPTLISPENLGRKFQIIRSAPPEGGSASLFPFDWVGIYNRDHFIKLGGFDGGINNPYWQLMDFGFRSWLWGEEIRMTQGIKLSYEGAIPVDDVTRDEYYRRFYLKNLAPVFRFDNAHLPIRRFPSCLMLNPGHPLQAWHDYTEGRRWVSVNHYRFSTDAQTLIGKWSP